MSQSYELLDSKQKTSTHRFGGAKKSEMKSAREPFFWSSILHHK